MVHGINLGVRYIIKLNKKIDYYDIFLNICILLRKMISIVDDNKIIILDNHILEKRFRKLSLANEYRKNVELYEYSLRGDTDLKWVDVYKYSSQIKFSNNVIIKSEEEINEYKQKYENEILDGTKNDMTNLIELNEIIHHENYYNCIKDLEQQITNIELSEDEIQLINTIKEIPLLNGLIEDEGFELMSERY
jgi:hypothetical protein